MITFFIEWDSTTQEKVKTTESSVKALFPEERVITVAEEERDSLVRLLEQTGDSYVCFLLAGDTLSGTVSDALKADLNAQKYPILRFTMAPDPEYVNAYGKDARREGGTGELNPWESPVVTPEGLYGYIFQKSLFAGIQTGNKFERLNSIYKAFDRDTRMFAIDELVYATEAILDSERMCPEFNHKSWYLDYQKYVMETQTSDCRQGYVIPMPVQYKLVLGIFRRYISNVNAKDKHVIPDEYPVFETGVYELLQFIDDEVIHNAKNYPGCTLILHFSLNLIRLKYGEDFSFRYEVEDKNGKKDILVYVGDRLLKRMSKLTCNLGLIDYDQKTGDLSINFHLEDYAEMHDFSVEAVVGGKVMPAKETYYYHHTKYFGRSVQKCYTYCTVVNLNKAMKGKHPLDISWQVTWQGHSVQLPLNAKNYLAKVSVLVKYSYWHFDKYMMTMEKGKTVIRIQVPTKGQLIGRELRFMLTNRKAEYGDFALKIRLLYWLTRPYFKNKRIWLTFDKLYKGGDCGEYLYRYAAGRQKETGIIPAYVINDGTATCKQLEKEGYKPLKFGTLKHLLYFLNAEVVFATHGGNYQFNGFNLLNVQFFQNLFRFDMSCIQHGLTVQKLATNSNRYVNNMKRYYCASKYEVQNLAHPVYGYEDKSILRLTGIPRYDGLVNNDQRQILITPTWRKYIAMPPSKSLSDERQYFDGFKETDYFKIYNELLSDSRLVETARRTGYKLIYLLHPVISVQIDDYPKHEAVEIVSAMDVNYEKILTESSLMVTDYSGVQFDFAYMRKPVVYYHHPKLPPHYEEGGFFYDTQGFGEICTGHDEIVEILCDYMENQCQLKPFYRDRQDDFFAFDDLNSCQRIYDDMLEYQKSKRV